MKNLKVKIYSKPECHLCDEVKKVIKKVRKQIDFNISEVDITKNEKIYKQYKERIPIVFINDKIAFKYKINETDFIKKLSYFE